MPASPGEKQVTSLLRTLPSGYSWVFQPQIIAPEFAGHTPSFVIWHPDLGVIVLEVKDWKHIEQVNSKKVRYREGTSRIYINHNPLRVARAHLFALRRQYEHTRELLKGKLSVRSSHSFPWTYGAIFAQIPCDLIEGWESESAWEHGRVLGEEDLTLETFEAALRRLPWDRAMEMPLDSSALDALRATINPALLVLDDGGEVQGVLTPTQASVALKPAIERPSVIPMLPDEFLSQEALEAIETLSVQLVRGIAGSGKTLVLVRRAQLLAEKYPHLRVLVLARNPELIVNLRQKIPNARNLDIMNFEQMCQQILGDKGRKRLRLPQWLMDNHAAYLKRSGLDAEFVADEILWRKELGILDNQQYLTMRREGRSKPLGRDKREAINVLFDYYVHFHAQNGSVDASDIPYLSLAALEAGHPLLHSYDQVLLDEAHDFPPSWVQVVKKILKPNGSLFMCDDPTQSMYPGYSWMQKGIHIVGRTRVLRVPFRCTMEITTAAFSLVMMDQKLRDSEEVSIPDLNSYELDSGGKPLLVQCRNLNHEIAYVHGSVAIAMRLGIPPEQIAVLCHREALLPRWQDLNREFQISVLSFERAKGREFKAVYIPELTSVFEQDNPDKDDPAATSVNRRLYMAMTRARSILVMSYFGQMPDRLEPLKPYVQYVEPT